MRDSSIYLCSALEYYSYNLVYLYERLFVFNFIEAFFDPTNATTDTLSVDVGLALAEITACEDASPLYAYQDYFEMRLYIAPAPNTYNNNYLYIMTCGEYLIYKLDTNTIEDGPFRLGSTVGDFVPPIGFRAIPEEFYYPDAIYNHRTGSDDYYFFFKGNKYVRYFWDKTREESRGTIQSNLPCSTGIHAAMRDANNNVFFFYNIGT